jgi:3-oxo-5-alpha-steroid 4-dehydrogenase 3
MDSTTTMPPLPIPALLQSFYIITASLALLANSVPAFHKRFVTYGKTIAAGADAGVNAKSNATASTTPIVVLFGKLLDAGAMLIVPHHYFAHFYIVAVTVSCFWAWQMVTHGAVYQYVAGATDSRDSVGIWKRSSGGEGMSIEQVILTWGCFFAQVVRRLYECLRVQKKGSSKMRFVHYAVGILFYISMSISIWIEGTGGFKMAITGGCERGTDLLGGEQMQLTISHSPSKTFML